ncbi:MAG: YiiX/YebB-like N1pC/P60 family cysteine hydrolase [Acidobacteriota bacterium]
MLCFRGRGVVSMAIRRLTKSQYSHVGLVYTYEGRVYSLEATGAGVRLALMSELVKRYHGGIDYFQIEGLTPEQRRTAISFGFQQLGKAYSHRGIIRFFRFLLAGNRERKRSRGSWFCSEIVAEAYRLAGSDLHRRSSAYTSPGDLAASPRVQFAFRIKS